MCAYDDNNLNALQLELRGSVRCHVFVACAYIYTLALYDCVNHP